MKPHIKLAPSDTYTRALVCGSPERAEFISGFLKSPKNLAKNREYHSYLGQFEGQDILVMSHGVGSAGAAIGFQELMDVGAKAIIRIGTAGGLYDDVQIGDIVVPTAAVRRDGVSRLMIPTDFPAVPDFELTHLLRKGMEATSARFKSGVIMTSDLFYPGLIDDDLKLFQKAGAVAVEMECSTLFVIGHLRGVRTGALLVLDGNPLKWEEGHYDPNPNRLMASMETCVQTALKALVSVKI